MDSAFTLKAGIIRLAANANTGRRFSTKPIASAITDILPLPCAEASRPSHCIRSQLGDRQPRLQLHDRFRGVSSG
jgi:hypothetical protein